MRQRIHLNGIVFKLPEQNKKIYPYLFICAYIRRGLMSIMKARHCSPCCGNLVIWRRRASFPRRHTCRSHLQGDEQKIRALGTSNIGWRPVVILENTSRRYTCRHHLGVATSNVGRARNLISLVKIYGRYLLDYRPKTNNFS